MVEITIKFKDRNRSDLKIKANGDMLCDPFYAGGKLVRIPIATNGKVEVWKTFSADIIEEMTEVVKHESEGVNVR